MIYALGNSLLFVTVATVTASLLGFFGLGLFMQAPLIFQSRTSFQTEGVLYGFIGFVLTIAVNLLECLPPTVTLLIAAFLLAPASSITGLWLVIVLGLTGGVVWSAVIARTTENLLTTELRKEYAKQLTHWGAPPLRSLALGVIVKHRKRELLSGGIVVLFYAIISDTTLGFLFYFAPKFQTAGVKYYYPSFGYHLSSLLQGASNGALVATIFGLLLLLGALLYLIDRLEARPRAADYRAVRRTDENPRDNQALAYVNACEVALYAAERQTFRLEQDESLPLVARPGEFVWLRGYSGSGKSLFIKSILGYAPPGARIKGVIDFKVSMDKVLLVFQEPSVYLYPYLTIDQISFLVAQRNWTDVAGNDEDLGKLAHKYIHQLSAGQKRIVAARIVFSRLDSIPSGSPRLLICDEADASLDREKRAELAERLRKLLETRKVGVVYVSHNEEFIASIQARRMTVFICEEESNVAHSGVLVSRLRHVAVSQRPVVSP